MTRTELLAALGRAIEVDHAVVMDRTRGSTAATHLWVISAPRCDQCRRVDAKFYATLRLATRTGRVTLPKE
jgi:hypothetical protein